MPVAAGRRQVEQRRAALAHRRSELDAFFDQLKRERLRSATYLFPNDLRTHEMALLHTRCAHYGAHPPGAHVTIRAKRMRDDSHLCASHHMYSV